MNALTETISVSITVNGQQQRVDVAPDLPLVDFLRDTLGLTGTKVGCDTGHCGACTVLMDGVSVKSCAVLAVQADGAEVTSIEGLAQAGGTLTPLQNRFWEMHGTQCGFCTPGMVLSMTDLLAHNPNPDEAEIRSWLDGNLCRCAVYQNVVRAVRAVAEQTS